MVSVIPVQGQFVLYVWLSGEAELRAGGEACLMEDKVWSEPGTRIPQGIS